MSGQRVLIVHSDLSAGGGAEAYALRIIAVCKNLGLDVSVIDVAVVADALAERGRIARLAGRLLLRARHLESLTWASVLRYVAVAKPAADLAIFTYGECGDSPMKHVRILHAPAIFSTEKRHLVALGVDEERRMALAVRRLYVRACRLIGGVSCETGSRCVLTVTNSAWTWRESVRATTDSAASVVVHPPVVAPSPAEGVARRDSDVVMLGRLVPNKRHRAAISIVREVAARSRRELRLVIVGRGDGRYVDELGAVSASSSDVDLVVDVSTAAVSEILAGSTFALHTYRSEHFGIAIAEMILAGCIPLVYDGGGAPELAFDPRCRFTSDDDAAVKLALLLELSEGERTKLVDDLRRGPAIVGALDFDRRFAKAIKPLIDDTERGVPRPRQNS